MSKIEWRPIKGVDEHYRVSNTGLIMTVGSKKYKTPTLLKSCGDEYLYNALRSNGKTKLVRVHRAVAEAFISNPDNKSTVNHIDGNKTNNNAKNLEWLSIGENITHARKLGLLKRRKEQHGTYNEYANMGCRCAECKQAAIEYRLSKKALLVV